MALSFTPFRSTIFEPYLMMAPIVLMKKVYKNFKYNACVDPAYTL